MIFQTLKELVCETRSYRTFDPTRPIKYDDMQNLIDSARLCASAANLQPLKYRICSEKEEVENVLALTKWAALIKDVKLPPDDGRPSGFIVVCHDKSVCEITTASSIDVGIAAQTIMLSATERGYGGCMIASFDESKISSLLSLPAELKPVLVIALGTPAETVIISNPKDSDVKYFRDSAGLHFVPKRLLKDVVIK